ncbi:hypothetical protein EOM33_04500 [Candidatus Saccharibacteria bacterium]|nr:hypothetical protein [Candidatus Saccharibacteria bacterium]
MASTTKNPTTSAKASATPATVQPATVQPAAQAPNLQSLIATYAAAVAAHSTPATLHNVLLQAQAQAQTLPAAAAVTVQAQSGYNAGGWRKPLMQAVAAAVGVVPVLVWQATNPANPKQVGQQPAFYGNANHANLAAAVYMALYSWGNVQGNKALRLARVQGKAQGKTGQAGNRLQVNVYNNVCAAILAALSNVPAATVPAAVQAGYKALNAVPAKGGIVFNGAYNTQLYNGNIAMVK